MKTYYRTVNACALLACLALISVISLQQSARAQQPLEVGLTVAPGATIVDFEDAFDYSDDYLQDWSNFSISYGVKGYLASKGNFQFGLEICHNELYYVYYRIPYGYDVLYREWWVSSTSVMVLQRATFGNFYLVFREGMHIFEGGNSLGLGLEPGYQIDITDNLNIPVGLKIGYIFDDGNPVSFAINTGLNYRFR